MSERKGYIRVLGAAILWGLSATAARFLLNQQVDTLLIVQTRVTISALLLLVIFMLFRREIFRTRVQDLWRFALLGVFGVAGSNVTYYFAIRESTVATAIIIQYTAPLVVMAYAVYAHEERITAVKLTAAIVSLLGCFLAVGAYDVSIVRITPLGLACGIGSIFTFAFLTVYTRHLVGRYGVWTVVFYSIAFASLFWFIVSPPWSARWQGVSETTWMALAVFAVISVLIPHSLYYSGLRRVVSSRAIITSTLEPVVAIVSAAALLGEYLEPGQIIGAVLVIAAIVLLQSRREPAHSSIQPVETADAA